MKRFLASLLALGLLLFNNMPVLAATDASMDYNEEAEARKSLTVQTNEIDNWPTGPALGAEAAYLIEANTDTVLYAKNADEKLYPASTTKMLTCLIAVENCSMDEVITFSQNAVFSLESGSSTIGIDPGESMTLRECLYGILVGSANEVANAVAEHIAGSTEAFAEMMNEKAAELGCTNSHFVNPHGLHNENHYTTAHDLALIAKAFFQNEQLAKIGNTASYHFEATSTQPDDFYIHNKHQLITGETAYEGIKGGKTGYTEQARQTLVTCAEKNGMRLICVILKEESPDQFYDTVKLFDYGFTNFTTLNIAENETKYSIEGSGFFHNSTDILGNSTQLLGLNENSYLIMPKTISFEDIDSTVSYDTDSDQEIAEITYSYHGITLGTATIDLLTTQEPTTAAVKKTFFKFCPLELMDNTIIINVRYLLGWITALALLAILISFIHSIFINYNLFDDMKRKHYRRRTRRSKKGPHF